MRRFELELEHNYKNRFVGRHLLRGSSTTTLGSSREADILLLGEDIGGVHAIIERSEQGWKISDLGNQQGTWIDKQPIVEQIIDIPMTVRIGGHTIKITPREINEVLFSNEQEKLSNQHDSQSTTETEKYHQVVVKRQGHVQETFLLKSDQPFQFHYQNETKKFPSPKSNEWQTSHFPPFTIQQRLVTSEENVIFRAEKVKVPFDPNLKLSMIVAGLIGVILVVLISFELRKPSTTLTAKPEMNNFTRMIYDAKTLKTKREQATKATKSIVGQAKSQGGPSPQPNNQSAPPKSQKVSQMAAKVVTNIRAAGLSQLIGKISKRAANTTSYVQTTGRTPDSVSTGPALNVAGTASVKPGTKANTQTFRVGGVTTAGKGGGSGEYKGAGGLSVGNVGNASVGVLEEETEVDGGLDKEVISNVIKSQIGQIRYCYERQLSASPDLYGKVQVKFTIGEEGNVVSQVIGSTTLSNAMVEGCILRRVSGWRFPKPKGGTAVVVTYPFLFKATQ